MSASQYPNPCRVCGAGPYERCRTLTTGRVTDTHQDRIWRQHQQPAAEPARPTGDPQ